MLESSNTVEQFSINTSHKKYNVHNVQREFFFITIFTNNTLSLTSDWKTSTAPQYLRFIFLNFS